MTSPRRVYDQYLGRLGTLDGKSIGAALTTDAYVVLGTDTTVDAITGEVTGTGYARQTFDCDYSDNVARIAAADEWPSFDLADLDDPATGVVFYVDESGDPDEGNLISFLPLGAPADVDGWPLEPLNGFAKSVAEGDLDARITALEALTVALEPFVDGNVDVTALANRLLDTGLFVGGGGDPAVNQATAADWAAPPFSTAIIPNNTFAFVSDTGELRVGNGGDVFADLPVVSGGGGGSGPDLSDDDPEALGTADSGTSPDASRSDHVHPAATVTEVGALIHGATGKTTPVDADEIGLVDSAASNILKKLTWANLKATLKTYFDTLYPSGSGTSSGTNTGDQTITLTGDITGSGTGSFATTIGSSKVTSAMIVDGTIVDADVNASAAIAQSKVASLTTDLAAKAPLASPALTGTPTAPTASAGTNSTQVASTAYADTAVANAVAGWTTKQAVRVVATSNLSLTGAATIDGVAVATGDRVLASAQSTGSQNGIYRANTAGAWTRTTDADTSAEVFSGIAVAVTAGTTNIRTFWVLTTADPITLGTTSLTFSALAVPVQSVFGRAGAVTAQAGDYSASDVGLGSVTNDAQAKAATTVTANNGLTGGGSLAANRTIGLDTIATARVLGNLSGSTAVPTAQTMAALATALGLDGRWQTISRQSLAVDTASLSFNTTGYSMIRIRIVGRNTNTASGSLSVRMTCNNDTGSNYSTGTGALTTFLNLGTIPASQTNANRTGFIEMNFNYLASSWSEGTTGSTAQSSTASTGGAIATNTLAWTGSTSAALTSIQLFPVSDNFAAGMQVLCEGLI